MEVIYFSSSLRPSSLPLSIPIFSSLYFTIVFSKVLFQYIQKCKWTILSPFHTYAHTIFFNTISSALNFMMWVSKVPNYDAYGLFRALHSHNPFYAPLQNLMVLESFNRGLQSACGTRFATTEVKRRPVTLWLHRNLNGNPLERRAKPMSIVDFIAVVSFGLTCFSIGYTLGKDNHKPQK